MKFSTPVVFGATAVALAVGSAYGGGAKSTGKDDPGFNALDANHDGQLSKTEATGNPDLSQKFTVADRNHDGKLSRTEYLIVMAKKDLGTVKDKLSHALGSEESSSSAGGSSSAHTK